MSYSPILRTSVSLAALLCASTALADVTANDVWEDWETALSGYGSEAITYTVDQSTPGTLVIEDLKLDLDLREYMANALEDADMQDMGISKITADFGAIRFVEQGDGTVKITAADNVPMTFSDDDGVVMSMEVTQDNLVAIASGTPELTNIALSADRYGFSIGEINDPEFMGEIDVRLSANTVTANYVIADGDTQKIDYDFDIGTLDFLVEASEPSEDISILMSGQTTGLETSAQMLVPAGETLGSPTLMMAPGFGMTANYQFDRTQMIFDVNDAGDQAQGSAAIGSGGVDLSIINGTMAYEGQTNDLAINLNVPDMPFPVSVNMAEYGFGIGMPLAPGEGPQDLGLKLSLVDLMVNDEIWMMADPSNALPHDPLTFILDIQGKANLFIDLMDQTQLENLTSVPGELLELSLKDLTLKAAGAILTGNGEFTFDNTDLDTFDGFPRPVGSVTANLKGANKLIDSLVGMGLVPEDQAMMGRMMMGMFARSVGDDELSSTLEVNEAGQVLANGQRIR